ncbi:MAG: hypothetical protein K2Z80_25670 [Xanthobacteraceae bacterium]|nr:hypothetical protein [Xanthobacteraceae bacterium]
MTYAHDITANQAPGLVLHETELFVADYYGHWLLFAAEAHEHLWSVLRENTELYQKLSDKLDMGLIDPGNAALELMSKLLGRDLLALDISDQCPELIPGLCALAALGFFNVNGDEVEMAMPAEIVAADVERVFSKLASLEDEQWRMPEGALAQLLER